MNRALLSGLRSPALRRCLHRGVDSTPPLRYTSGSEKIALYSLIAVSFLSYPTYVLLNLDRLRPRAENKLRDDVQEQIEAMRAARK